MAAYLIEGSKEVRELTNSEKALLNRWYDKVVVYTVAHHEASQRYGWIDSVLEYSIIGLAGAAGLCDTLSLNKLVAMAAMALSLLAAMCVAAASHLKCAEKRDAHEHASMRFRSLEKKIKALFQYTKVRSAGASIRVIRQKYDEVLGASPLLSDSIMKRASAKGITHELTVMDINFDENSSKKERGNFSEKQLNMLRVRLAMARVNRGLCVTTANSLFTKSFYLGTAMATIACVATSLSAVSFSGVGPEWIRQAGAIIDFALSILGFVPGQCRLSEKVKDLHDISSRWSALAREIEEAIYTQPHHGPSELALSLENKCSDFVTEMKGKGLMDNFKHRGCVEVEEQIKDEANRFRVAAEGYAPPTLLTTNMCMPNKDCQ